MTFGSDLSIPIGKVQNQSDEDPQTDIRAINADNAPTKTPQKKKKKKRSRKIDKSAANKVGEESSDGSQDTAASGSNSPNTVYDNLKITYTIKQQYPK